MERRHSSGLKGDQRGRAGCGRNASERQALRASLGPQACRDEASKGARVHMYVLLLHNLLRHAAMLAACGSSPCQWRQVHWHWGCP